MTQRTSTQLGNEFQDTDPQDQMDNLLDSILVKDEAFTHDADFTLEGDVDDGYLMWDSSEGALAVAGTASYFVNAPDDLDGSFDVGGTFTNVTSGTAISGYFKVKVNGTLFKVPFYQDA